MNMKSKLSWLFLTGLLITGCAETETVDNTGKTEVSVCQEGSRKCEGSVIRICVSDKWQDQEFCNGETPVCSEAKGIPICIK